MFWCISVLVLLSCSLQLEERKLIHEYGNKDPDEEGFRHHMDFLPLSLLTLHPTCCMVVFPLLAPNNFSWRCFL